MACLAHLTYMDIGNVIMMSGTSLTMCFKVFRHPVYQIPIGSVSILLFINKMAEAELKLSQKLAQSPWRPFRICCFVNSENVAGRLGVPRGNSR